MLKVSIAGFVYACLLVEIRAGNTMELAHKDSEFTLLLPPKLLYCE